MISLYKNNYALDKPAGAIIILPHRDLNEYIVTMYHNEQTKTGQAYFNVNASSFEKAQSLYNDALHEIERKERLYMATGAYDKLDKNHY